MPDCTRKQRSKINWRAETHCGNSFALTDERVNHLNFQGAGDLLAKGGLLGWFLRDKTYGGLMVRALVVLAGSTAIRPVYY